MLHYTIYWFDYKILIQLFVKNILGRQRMVSKYTMHNKFNTT